jgi:hypothetical protein
MLAQRQVGTRFARVLTLAWTQVEFAQIRYFGPANCTDDPFRNRRVACLRRLRIVNLAPPRVLLYEFSAGK